MTGSKGTCGEQVAENTPVTLLAPLITPRLFFRVTYNAYRLSKVNGFVQKIETLICEAKAIS